MATQILLPVSRHSTMFKIVPVVRVGKWSHVEENYGMEERKSHGNHEKKLEIFLWPV